MSQARHIDRDARMIWLSLMRARRAMTVNELVMHWTPVFKADLVEDALKRLTAAGHASFVSGGNRQQWQVSEADAVLPGYEGEANREWCRTGRSRSVPALLQARPDALHLGQHFLSCNYGRTMMQSPCTCVPGRPGEGGAA